MNFGISQKIANYVMRPPRAKYTPEDLGPSIFQFRNKIYERIDFTCNNPRNLRIQCSLFKCKYEDEPRTTVIILHANSSSRLSAKNYLVDLLPYFNVIGFDCSGSGLSEGKYVTLGYYEKEDLREVIKYLKLNFNLNKIILWGRSMGAVTGLLYTAKYGGIQTVVADNAFSDLQELCKQLKDHFFALLPDFIVDSLVDSTQQYLDQNICKEQKINFNLKQLKPSKIVQKINCPIFYIYSQEDKIVNNRHSKKLYKLSNFQKRIASVPGDHNGPRETQIKGKVLDYLLQLELKERKSVLTTKEINIQLKKNQKQNFQYSDSLLMENRKNQIQTESEVVFDSPFNKRLCQSYILNTKANSKLSTHNIDNDLFKRNAISPDSILNTKKLKSFKSFEDFETQNQSDINDKYDGRMSLNVRSQTMIPYSQIELTSSKRIRRKKIFDK